MLSYTDVWAIVNRWHIEIRVTFCATWLCLYMASSKAVVAVCRSFCTAGLTVAHSKPTTLLSLAASQRSQGTCPGPKEWVSNAVCSRTSDCISRGNCDRESVILLHSNCAARWPSRCRILTCGLYSRLPFRHGTVG